MTEFAAQTQSDQHTRPSYLSENYFSELSEQLEKIAQASTHYQTLTLESSASYEQVVAAYKSLVSLLYPADDLRRSLSNHSLGEVEKAFRKVSSAFSTLVETDKRAEYDAILSSMPTETIAPESQTKKSRILSTAELEEAALPLTTERAAKQNRLGVRQKETRGLSPASTKALSFTLMSSNRRRSQRLKCGLPVKVGGIGRNFERWREETESLDVSKTGISLFLKRRVRSGNVLQISLPLPEKFRPQGYTGSNFNSYVLVRRVDPPLNGVRLVALEFIGNQPPPGYAERPWAVFKPKSWSGKERRRVDRQEHQEKVRLEYYNSAFHLIMKEDTMSENVSDAGMRVVARFVPDEFEFVKVICLERSFESLAIVRSRFLTKDGLERLSIQFLSREKSRL